MMRPTTAIRAIVSTGMRMRERSVIRVMLAVIAVAAVAGGARAAHADLTEAALVLLVTILAVGTLGFPAGLAAALVGFLALNWFFTEPTGSFKIHRTDDVVALAVFAASAALVGWTVQRLSTLRRTALQREAEAKVRLDLTNRLLTGADVDDALHNAAGALAELFSFEACILTTSNPLSAADELAGANVRVDGPGVTLLARAPQQLTPADRELLEALIAGLAAGVDRLSLQEEVREARLVAEVGRQRAGFLSAVSHNLRTPLTAVKAAAGTLLSSWSRLAPEERRELLETISDEAERLERLVRNTLELSRIRAGALDIEPERVDIADLVQHAVRRLRPIARAHRVRLDVDDDLPPVTLDVTMAEQILLNLLENALRFAPPGSEIVVGAHALADDGHDEVELRVADHGPGVPAEARDRIFEEFQSAETRPDRTGTGLGLAIVRALVVAHGGSVRYEDTPGGGATFVCTFPREARAA
jgi:two-component system sensor histidine kinase KdpD